MGIEFRDSAGRACSSTQFSKALLSDCLVDIDGELAKAIATESDWRKNYQHYFYELAKLEATVASFDFNKFATELPSRVFLNDETLLSAAKRGFANRQPIAFETIKGVSQRQSISLPHAASGLDQTQATKDALRALDWVRANKEVDISSDILVALAGNAELSATRSWLDWGGTVAVLARQGSTALDELVAHAKRSAGTLLLLATGVDLVSEIELAAHFIRTLSHEGRRLVIASYGYAPGANQIKLQAAQLALVTAALQLPKAQVALTWLGTPLDVIATDDEIATMQIAGYRSRSLASRLRDAFWQLFGHLQPAAPEILAGEPTIALFDCSSNRQGPSYLLAKHSERWLAMAAARMGVRIAFNVAPPATTRSVLGAKKVLARTYRGLTRFGVRPLEANDTAVIMAALLVRGLHDRGAPQDTGSTAIHAGFWTLPYRLDGVLVPASLLG